MSGNEVLVCPTCLALGNSCGEYGCYSIRHVVQCAEQNQTLPANTRMSFSGIMNFIDRCVVTGCEFGDLARKKVLEYRQYFPDEEETISPVKS